MGSPNRVNRTGIKVLWVATKPPWPLIDGGRLLLWNTLRALRDTGVEVTLVAPHLDAPERREACTTKLLEVCRPSLVQARVVPRGVHLLTAALRRRPWTIERHASWRVRRRVEQELAAAPFDWVVAEQVQSLTQIVGTLPSGLPLPPVLLRAQNVESDLWFASAAASRQPAPLRGWLRHQARLLARFEARAVARCAATIALTEQDAESLRNLAACDGTESRVEVVPAPVEASLTPGPELEGEPAVVLFGSAGWAPNAEGARAFAEQAWPEVQRRLPAAVLHLFGDLLPGEAPADDRGSIRRHASPERSETALARSAVLVVPLAVASGVRMKILEAWARGVVVVATPAAARGLVAEDGQELLIAERPGEWAEAVSRAVVDQERLASAARRRLAMSYAPEVVAHQWHRLFSDLGISTDRRSADSRSADSGQRRAS